MNTLSNRNLIYFSVSTLVITVCCFPLFYRIMIHFYAEDLDELVEYRKNEFVEKIATELKESDIPLRNRLNDDQKILPYRETYPLDEMVQEEHYSPSDDGVVAYRTLYVPVRIEGKTYVLMTRTAMIERDDLMEMMLWQYGLLILVLGIFLFFLQWWISKRLWRLFYRNLELIRRFNLERESMPRFEVSNISEFAQLTENLEILIGNNLKIYRQQKEFVENASHEFQTPLAIFRSQLDMLLQDSHLTEKQVESIQSLYEAALRLTRMNKNLLLLAKIENSQFKEMEDFDLAEMLNARLALFHDRLEDKDLLLKTDVSGRFPIKANRILTESLLNNLIVNAIRYTDPGGCLEIVLSERQLLIKNSGREPLNGEKIFSRFNHTFEKNKDGSGTGLGLSIVRQICKLHGWKIRYRFEEGMHCFELYFAEAGK